MLYLKKDNSRRKHRVHCLGNAVIAAISLMMSALLLRQMILIPGTTTREETVSNLSVSEKYLMKVNNQISDALAGTLSIKKSYWIGEESFAAPRPNPDCYGETDDPAEMMRILEQAKDVLDGQEVLFSADRNFLSNSKIYYYLDDTILAIVWKEGRIGGTFTMAEVKVMHPSQFRRFLAGDKFGSGTLMLTTEMAESVHAVVAGSGDFYGYRGMGIVVHNGVVYRNNQGIPDTCYVTEDGDLMPVRAPRFDSMEDAQKFVEDNHIRFSLSFGPTLIENGHRVNVDTGSVGETKEHFSRAAICQLNRLHYLYLAVNSESGYYQLPTMEELADSVEELGCMQAYAVDGGQTATVVMDNQVRNRVNYGSQRRISDIIYFATAIPEGD